MNIEEMIEDAKAEESVKAQMKKIDRAFEEKRSETVTISLTEYLVLRQKETDFTRLVKAITNDLEPNMNCDYLRISGIGENTINTIKVLFPELYQEILTDFKNTEGSEQS